jgi:hypothetical protein
MTSASAPGAALHAREADCGARQHAHDPHGKAGRGSKCDPRGVPSGESGASAEELRDCDDRTWMGKGILLIKYRF